MALADGEQASRAEGVGGPDRAEREHLLAQGHRGTRCLRCPGLRSGCSSHPADGGSARKTPATHSWGPGSRDPSRTPSGTCPWRHAAGTEMAVPTSQATSVGRFPSSTAIYSSASTTHSANDNHTPGQCQCAGCSCGTGGLVTGTMRMRASRPVMSAGLVVYIGRSWVMAAIIRSAARPRGLRPAAMTSAVTRP